MVDLLMINSKPKNYFYKRISILFFILLSIVLFTKCEEKESVCFECKQPYLYSVPGLYQTNVEIFDSPIPEIIPNGFYRVYVEIYDCFFTNDCSSMKTVCSKSEFYGNSCNKSEDVSACSYKIRTNIPPFNKNEYTSIRGIVFPFACREMCVDSIRCEDEYYFLKNNKTQKLRFYVFALLSPPFCEKSEELKTSTVNLFYYPDKEDNKSYSILNEVYLTFSKISD